MVPAYISDCFHNTLSGHWFVFGSTRHVYFSYSLLDISGIYDMIMKMILAQTNKTERCFLKTNQHSAFLHILELITHHTR
jgi:hypothetical protein